MTQPGTGAGDKAPSSAVIDIFNPDTSSLELAKLTPSERFFSLATRVDIQSHEISGDFEWKLFVDLRAEQQWISRGMPPQKWLEATRLYNERLNTKALEDHRQFVHKHRQALVNKLSWIEGQVLEQLATGNYTCE